MLHRVCAATHGFTSAVHPEQNEVRSLLAHLFSNNDQVGAARIVLPNVLLMRCWFSQGLLDAEVATVGEVERAVALAHAAPATPEGGSVSAARVPASPRCQSSLHTLSSSSSSDFIVLGNDSDSDFVVHEQAAS
jgi:hypothetical protein